ncbi:hypothetical protein [Sporosarcina sp. FSL W7-1283]|uniref:hypothetical protein n=1 Tax=Sporosarcina sp. FSL W7-1283 TaxID=2921560 RepID=UPI0030F60163
MLKITDKMVEVLNSMMDSATYTKDEILVFETYTDLAKHIYENDLDGFLRELEDMKVYDVNRNLLENFFYEHSCVIEDESYGWIFYV